MRHIYLVCYDIADPKRLQKVHKKVQAFAINGQKSFYECLLSSADLNHLRDWFKFEINQVEDRIHIFQLDNRQTPQYFGVARPISFKPFVLL